MGDQGNCLADMQGWPPEMQRGGARCKHHSCFHAFDRHAKRRADMQGWPPEMQRTILHLGQPPLHVGLVLPRTTAERSFCICHPCMSALLFYYFTILLLYYFTPATVLPRPMFRVGRPRCTKKNCISDSHFCMSALLFYYFTMLLFYYFTPDTVLPRPMFGVGRPRCKKVLHVLPRTTAERSFCISDSHPCMSALLFYYFTIVPFLLFHSRYSTAAADV